MFYSIIDCRGKVSFRVTRIPLWEDWWICRHVAYVVTIPGNVSPAVSYPDLLSGCCVRSECGHNRTVFQFIFPSLWRTRFHRFHLPISIFPIVHDTIRNFFRATNRVSLPPIFDRSLFNLHHELKDKFVISAVKFTRLHGCTVHDEFLFPFINRMSLCAVVGSIRVSFVPNRKMSITVPTWTESPSPPLSSHQFWNRNCSTDFAVAGQRGFPGIVYPEKFRNREARFKCLECTFGAATIPAGVTAPPCTCNFLFTSIAN